MKPTIGGKRGFVFSAIKKRLEGIKMLPNRTEIQFATCVNCFDQDERVMEVLVESPRLMSWECPECGVENLTTDGEW